MCVRTILIFNWFWITRFYSLLKKIISLSSIEGLGQTLNILLKASITHTLILEYIFFFPRYYNFRQHVCVFYLFMLFCVLSVQLKTAPDPVDVIGVLAPIDNCYRWLNMTNPSEHMIQPLHPIIVFQRWQQSSIWLCPCR